MWQKHQFKDLKKNQRNWYSGKKKKHTIKTQVIVNLANQLILTTNFDRGRRHDFKLYKQTRLKFNPRIKQKADTAYKSNKYPQIQTPHKKPRKSKNNRNPKLTIEQKLENKQFSSKRIVIENVFSSLKKFKIIHDTYRNRRKGFGLRFNLIAGIFNLELEYRNRNKA